MTLFLLVASALSLWTSIELIRHHDALNKALDDITSYKQVDGLDYVLSGVLGYICAPIAVVSILVCLVLVVLEI